MNPTRVPTTPLVQRNVASAPQSEREGGKEGGREGGVGGLEGLRQGGRRKEGGRKKRREIGGEWGVRSVPGR